MFAQLLKHMIEKPDAGIESVLPATIQIYTYGNIGFARFTINCRGPHFYNPDIIKLQHRQGS